jgi:hypothetical protein
MAGKIKQMLDTIITLRSQGKPTLVITTRTKLIMKGIDPEQYTLDSPDDPAVIEKLRLIAAEMKIALTV